MISLLLVPAALATDLYEDTFLADNGRWSGGSVADGVLTVQDGDATLLLGEITALEATLLLRKDDAGSLSLVLGDQSWTAAYTNDGGLSLGEQGIPFPEPHRVWVPDDEPLLREGPDVWDAGNVLHCDVHYEASTGLWYLYYTGEMSPGYAYRQIGVALSTDGVTWEEYAGNPILTIDYDRTTVDGIHVHMPSVVVDPSDGAWHMYYSCYQNSVGNRICHATSDDGLAWTPQGVVLDLGATGEFDSGSLRMPDVQIDASGTWHMLYNGTDPEQHYGPTGYATSADGVTWTKGGEITADETRLQGGGLVQTAYGVEQYWNCADVFCYSWADPSDWTTWTDEDGVILEKGWADWSSGYIQAPTLWVVDNTYHMWFNAYDYAVDDETLAHARSEPAPGETFELALRWDGTTLSASFDGGPTLETVASGVTSLTLRATGAATLDEIRVLTEPASTDSGGQDSADDSGDAADSGEETDSAAPADSSADADSAAAPSVEGDGGCGCGGGKSAAILLPLMLLALSQGRKSEGRRSAR